MESGETRIIMSSSYNKQKSFAPFAPIKQGNPDRIYFLSVIKDNIPTVFSNGKTPGFFPQRCHYRCDVVSIHDQKRTYQDYHVYQAEVRLGQRVSTETHVKALKDTQQLAVTLMWDDKKDMVLVPYGVDVEKVVYIPGVGIGHLHRVYINERLFFSYIPRIMDLDAFKKLWRGDNWRDRISREVSMNEVRYKDPDHELLNTELIKEHWYADMIDSVKF